MCFVINFTLMEYKQAKYQTKSWLPFVTVSQSFDEGWERSLVFFLQLRQLHKKPIIYNYSYKSLSKQLNCSLGTIKRHLLILIEKGLVSVNNKNLCLTGTTRLLKTFRSFLVPVILSPDRKIQLSYLRYVLVKRNLRLQEKAHQKALNIINYHKGFVRGLTSKQVKGLIKSEQALVAKTGIPVGKGLRSDFLLSNVKIGALCGRGLFTGLKIQKAFNELGLIESSSNFRFISTKHKFTRKQFFIYQETTGKFTSKSVSLSNKGNVYKRLPNKIKIIQ